MPETQVYHVRLHLVNVIAHGKLRYWPCYSSRLLKEATAATKYITQENIWFFRDKKKNKRDPAKLNIGSGL